MVKLTVMSEDPLTVLIEVDKPEARGAVFLREGPYGLEAF